MSSSVARGETFWLAPTRRTGYPGLHSGSLSQQFDWRHSWFLGQWEPGGTPGTQKQGAPRRFGWWLRDSGRTGQQSKEA